jgi:hypothetical protein
VEQGAANCKCKTPDEIVLDGHFVRIDGIKDWRREEKDAG